MSTIIEQMLYKYNCLSLDDYENALKEIIQEIALLGMWRSKFFEIGAFYGGSALRILYGLDRFSEDLDFSLLKPDKRFDISKYESFLKRELNAFDFEVEVKKKSKTVDTAIESAFIKANTSLHLIKVKSNLKTDKNKILKIKLEVDSDPPQNYHVEVRPHYSPVPFSVKTFTLPTLFSGKLAALLFRPYKFNVKGRDWYDFLWYISRNIPFNINHLKARLVQIEKWPEDKELTLDDVKKLVIERINSLNLDLVKKDVLPFVKDHEIVDGWSIDLFRNAALKLAHGFQAPVHKISRLISGCLKTP